jgi:poly(A) polymerase
MHAEALAREIVVTLRAAGHRAYLVGGCVRDLLLGVRPKDFDVATDARPDRIMDLFPNSGRVGAHFGVVLVRNVFEQVEVATFRSDQEYTDGRRPDAVHFELDPAQDALRRDFTINGLLMDPESGEVLDFVGGRADLERREIRAIGDAEARFHEDHLRLLRAIRFAARLGFQIAPATFAAIRRNSASIAKVSCERVREELTRILTEGGARYGFELLDSTGLLEAVLPEIAAMKGVEQPPQFHPEGDVWLHTLGLLERLDHPTPTLAWGALLHDVGKPNTFSVSDRIRFNGHVEEGVRLAQGIMNRLRFSRDDMDQIEALIANHMKFMDTGKMKESRFKRFLRMPMFHEHLELHRLDLSAGSGNLASYDMVRGKLDEYTEQAVLKPEPLLTGKDLIESGYEPGPLFKEILEAVEDAQLEGELQTSGEAMQFVRERYPI